MIKILSRERDLLVCHGPSAGGRRRKLLTSPLPARRNYEPTRGLEPPTSPLRRECSTIELRRHRKRAKGMLRHGRTGLPLSYLGKIVRGYRRFATKLMGIAMPAGTILAFLILPFLLT